MAGRPQTPPTTEGKRHARRAATLAKKIDAQLEVVERLGFEYRHALRQANDEGVKFRDLEEITGRGGSSISSQIAQARREAAEGDVPDAPSRNGRVAAAR